MELFNGQKPVLPFWINQVWHELSLDDLPFFEWRALRTLLATFKAGRTCAGDNCVAEMLIALDIDILDHIADAFRLRLRNHKSEHDEEAWKVICITLVQKVRDQQP